MNEEYTNSISEELYKAMMETEDNIDEIEKEAYEELNKIEYPETQTKSLGEHTRTTDDNKNNSDDRE